jgi:two-component system, chemotaxis family, response regulator Rcp1
MTSERRRASVIVVEDNATDVFMIREAIAAQQLDVELEVYQDGEAAISLIERLEEQEAEPHPRLILLDLNLPRRNGLEVLARLRSSPTCAEIPVIVMTSSAAASDRAGSEALGAVAYFQKPSEYVAFLEIGNIIESQLR